MARATHGASLSLNPFTLFEVCPPTQHEPAFAVRSGRHPHSPIHRSQVAARCRRTVPVLRRRLCCVGACAASSRRSDACAASKGRPSPTRRHRLTRTSKSSSRLSRQKRSQTFRYVVVLFGVRRCLCCVAPVLCRRPACAVRGRVAAEAGWWASLRSHTCHPLRAALCARLSTQGMAAVRACARHSRRRAQPLASARARAFALPHAVPAEPCRR